MERMYLRMTPELKLQIRKLAKREGRSSLANMCEVLLVIGIAVRETELNIGERLDAPLDDDE